MLFARARRKTSTLPALGLLFLAGCEQFGIEIGEVIEAAQAAPLEGGCVQSRDPQRVFKWLPCPGFGPPTSSYCVWFLHDEGSRLQVWGCLATPGVTCVRSCQP